MTCLKTGHRIISKISELGHAWPLLEALAIVFVVHVGSHINLLKVADVSATMIFAGPDDAVYSVVDFHIFALRFLLLSAKRRKSIP
jgi:hypothetical protein